jgi:hypothetical protein
MLDLKKIYISTAIMFINAVLILVCLDLLIGVAIKVKHYAEGRNEVVEKEISLLPPFDKVEGRDRFLKREKLEPVVFAPYRHWRDAERHGAYYSTDANGVRQTIKTPNLGARKVFMFGGSTLKGPNIADEMTIPSRLQVWLGNDYDVYNYAQNGYNSTQQIIYLLELLAQGKVPDTLIMYVGMCDVPMNNKMVEDPRAPFFLADRFIDMQKESVEVRKNPALYSLKMAYEQSNIAYFVLWMRIKLGLIIVNPQKQMDDLARRNSDEDVKQWVGKAVNNLEENIKVIKALGAYYGFATYVFWEPTLQLEARNVLPYEKKIMSKKSAIFVLTHKKMYPVAKKAFSGREDEHVYFLGDIFKDAEFPVFIDTAHLGPQACDYVARKMAEKLKY